jgi:cell division inhibitor SulA
MTFGAEYFVRSKEDRVWVYLPVRAKDALDVPLVFVNHWQELPLEDLMRILPLLQSIIDDPRAQARWQAWLEQKER